MKLQPIERGPGGSLPRMTAAQRKRANALIRNTCCNYDSGHCLLLDDGDACTCPQTIFSRDDVKRCAKCGAAFVPHSNRAKYCGLCAAKVHREQKNASDRKRRGRADK